jgi:hypothetical protein
MIYKISSICVPKNLKLETKVKRLCVTLSTQTTLKILCETLCKTLRDFVLKNGNVTPLRSPLGDIPSNKF